MSEVRKRLYRATVLEAASRQFAAHGYAAVDLRAVAADAGLTEGDLDDLFGGREELFLTVLGLAHAALESAVEGLPVEAPVERLFDALFAGIERSAEIFTAVWDSIALVESDRILRRYLDDRTAILARLRCRLGTTERLDASQAERAAVALLATIESAFHRWSANSKLGWTGPLRNQRTAALEAFRRELGAITVRRS